MNTQIPFELRAQLTHAAEADIDINDLSRISNNASDRVHALLYDVQRAAQKRFQAHFAGIPSYLEEAANQFVFDKGEEIDRVRRERMIVGSRKQRMMREQRLAQA